MLSLQKAVSDDLLSWTISASTKLWHNKGLERVEWNFDSEFNTAAEVILAGTITLDPNPYMLLNTTNKI